MSLIAPWGKPLPAELKTLAARLKRQRGVPLGEPQPGRAGGAIAASSIGGTQGSGGHQQRRRKAVSGSGQGEAPADAVQQRDQPMAAGAAQDAPLYPLGALELRGRCLGVGECGNVLQGM